MRIFGEVEVDQFCYDKHGSLCQNGRGCCFVAFTRSNVQCNNDEPWSYLSLKMSSKVTVRLKEFELKYKKRIDRIKGVKGIAEF